MRAATVTFLLLSLLATSALAAPEWVREIEIRAEEAVEGQTDLTVRFAPAKSQLYDHLIFECIYHQEFPWVNVRGKRYTKIHEPVRFEYRRPTVKFVDDLDANVSFRVPTSRTRLEKKYGPKAFNEDAPITIDRLVITGEAEGAAVWTFELKIPGKYVVAELLKATGADAQTDADDALPDFDKLD